MPHGDLEPVAWPRGARRQAPLFIYSRSADLAHLVDVDAEVGAGAHQAVSVRRGVSVVLERLAQQRSAASNGRSAHNHQRVRLHDPQPRHALPRHYLQHRSAYFFLFASKGMSVILSAAMPALSQLSSFCASWLASISAVTAGDTCRLNFSRSR